MRQAQSETGSSITTSTLGWAFYLASSWTWVIGMYLPVLLVRDLGFAGWLAFAVPNVVGAAAMGWVLRSRRQAIAIIERHASAVSLFTAVTIAFQVFVLLWLLPALVGPGGGALVLLALICATAMPVAQALSTRLNATAVWCFSAATFIMLALSGVLAFPQEPAGAQPAMGLVGLIPACALGFALCPYLDVTFLNARLRTSAPEARFAFTLGFGVLFLAMIVFALLYADSLLAWRIRGTLAWLLAGHFAIQASFTIAAHTSLTRPTPANLAALLVAGALGVIAVIAELRELTLFEIAIGEVIYRGFLGFYGLIFPAYVLIVMLARGSLVLYAVACALALPFFAIGFIGGAMPWAGVGVAIILVGGLVARRSVVSG